MTTRVSTPEDERDAERYPYFLGWLENYGPTIGGTVVDRISVYRNLDSFQLTALNHALEEQRLLPSGTHESVLGIERLLSRASAPPTTSSRGNPP
jgi:hypothetical protein